MENRCTAIVVDALRASATVAYMLDAGATEILAVRDVEEAYSLKRANPHALLAGERGGLPPQGFDLGNSPRDVARVRGKRVIFTTTTGAGRLVEVWGAPALFMGSTVNASAVAKAAIAHERDVVVIPAGLMNDPAFNAQEDWTGAAAIAFTAEHMCGELGLGEGGHRYTYWHDRILCDGIPALFANAPHSQNLRNVGLADDIHFCAQVDTVGAVPMAVGFDGVAVRLLSSAAAH
ncbi:MAG: 2-phosphosulfolactate phosphatase [Candidatus Hydrogenedentes bacterium]|nr:2-phosphosulfolactate phosphatase [Candidatus Hydrogenedentota bacterium]